MSHTGFLLQGLSTVLSQWLSWLLILLSHMVLSILSLGAPACWWLDSPFFFSFLPFPFCLLPQPRLTLDPAGSGSHSLQPTGSFVSHSRWL